MPIDACRCIYTFLMTRLFPTMGSWTENLRSMSDVFFVWLQLFLELRIAKYADFIEEDEEVFLRSSIYDSSNLKHIKMAEDFVESDSDESVSDVTLWLSDSCCSEQPMKDS